MKTRKLLDSELNVINIGLDIFLDGLKAQNVKVIQAYWKPTPDNKGAPDKESEDILSKIL